MAGWHPPENAGESTVGTVNKRRTVALKTTRFIRRSGKQNKKGKNSNSFSPQYIVGWCQLLSPFSFFLFLLASHSAGQVLSFWETKLGNLFLESRVELRNDIWFAANWRAHASVRFQNFRFTWFGLNFFVPFFQIWRKKNLPTLGPYSKSLDFWIFSSILSKN